MDLLKSYFFLFLHEGKKEVSNDINNMQLPHFGEASKRLRSAQTRGSQLRPTSAISLTSTKVLSNHDLTRNTDFTKMNDAVPAKIPIMKVELTEEEMEIEKPI